MSLNPLLEIFVRRSDGELESHGSAVLSGRDLVELLSLVAERRGLPQGVSFTWLSRFDPAEAVADAAVLPDGTTGERPPKPEECSQPAEVRASLHWLLRELESGNVPEAEAFWRGRTRDRPYDREELMKRLEPDLLSWLSICDHAEAEGGVVLLDYM